MVADFMADNEKESKGLISEIEVSRRKTATSYKKDLIRLPHLSAAENTLPLPVAPAPSSSRKCNCRGRREGI